MTRQARVRITAADARRINQVADVIGWTGAALTVWCLAAETDGLPVDEAIQLILLAHRARHPDPQAGDDWTVDPVLRSDRGVPNREPFGPAWVRAPRTYRTVTYPGRGKSLVIPPVPGVPGGEWTLLRYAEPLDELDEG